MAAVGAAPARPAAARAREARAGAAAPSAAGRSCRGVCPGLFHRVAPDRARFLTVGVNACAFAFRHKTTHGKGRLGAFSVRSSILYRDLSAKGAP